MDKQSKGELFKRLLRYLSIRPRSSKEVIDYLTRSGISQDYAEEIIDQLDQCGIVDDKFFAESFFKNKLRKGFSPRFINKMLHIKGINSKIKLDVTLDCLNEIKNLVIRKYCRSFENAKTSKEREKILKRVYSFLIYRGFSYSEISQIVKEVKKFYKLS